MQNIFHSQKNERSFVQYFNLQNLRVNFVLNFREQIYVSAYNELSYEMFLIELPKEKGLEVLQTFDQSFE